MQIGDVVLLKITGEKFIILNELKKVAGVERDGLYGDLFNLTQKYRLSRIFMGYTDENLTKYWTILSK